MVDELVSLTDSKTRGPTAKLEYKRLLKNVKANKKDAYSKQIKEDLKDMEDGVTFDPDFDV